MKASSSINTLGTRLSAGLMQLRLAALVVTAGVLLAGCGAGGV